MLWQFMYHRGPAPLNGVIETEGNDEGTAMRVAIAWCSRNGMRSPAGIRPMILADEAILKLPELGPEPEELPDAVAATTGSGFVQTVKAALGVK